MVARPRAVRGIQPVTIGVVLLVVLAREQGIRLGALSVQPELMTEAARARGPRA